jgi:hypothetical protein
MSDHQNLCAAQNGGLVTGGTGCNHFRASILFLI